MGLDYVVNGGEGSDNFKPLPICMKHFILRQRQEGLNLSGVRDLGTLHIDMIRQLGRPYRSFLLYRRVWSTSDNKQGNQMLM
jgi:hypothetical protein